jgi:hypothetical protein
MKTGQTSTVYPVLKRLNLTKTLKFAFVFEREFDEREIALQIEFAADVRSMSINGASADEKNFSDFSRRISVGN